MLPPQFVSLLITLLQRIEQFSEQDQTKAMVSHILGPVPLRGRGYMAGRTNMAKNETLDVNGARIRKNMERAVKQLWTIAASAAWVC